ncbi:hypothetical protein PC119_g24004 [Phytophthora cactorum]|uniref:Uncharacterized protein n=1 Tax=Phytophthora cactorum TaxID=29920 RepID=A0A8T1AZA2_9STRA|nr:hypothetical protein PC117_g24274 [Phytophthora cactorum]KAG2969176.1 hypothetical protein PC119_g24004 [Phytophthora cactorum]
MAVMLSMCLRCQMTSESAASGGRGRQLDPQQCLYPVRCSNKRAFKKNGERHWLCTKHREHQNVMQRDHYRRVAKNTKSKTKEKTKSKTKTAQKMKKVEEEETKRV